MHASNPALLAALVAGSSVVSALPLGSHHEGPSFEEPQHGFCREPSRHIVAKFDDIENLPAITLLPVPTPYDDLNFEGWNIVTVIDVELLPGVTPASGDQMIGTGIENEVLKGGPKFSINYPDSKVKSFDLQSLAYACTVNAENGLTDPAAACIVEITGFKGDENTGDNEQVCHQRLRYDPDGPIALGHKQMAFAEIEDCKGLTYATMDVSFDGTLDILSPLAALLFDNVAYTLNYCDEPQEPEPHHGEEPHHEEPHHEDSHHEGSHPSHHEEPEHHEEEPSEFHHESEDSDDFE